MKLLDYIKEQKLYGIIREDDDDKALEILHGYVEGGLNVVELNCSLNVLKEASKMDIVVAQGGIVTRAQALEAIECGARIIASPIFQSHLIRFASVTSSFLIPSVTTPNEAYSAWRARMPMVKIYPVAQMGGVEYIKELKKPMPFLSILPCGFVKIDEISDYIKAGADMVGIGRELYLKEYNDMVQCIKELKKMVR